MYNSNKTADYSNSNSSLNKSLVCHWVSWIWKPLHSMKLDFTLSIPLGLHGALSTVKYPSCALRNANSWSYLFPAQVSGTAWPPWKIHEYAVDTHIGFALAVSAWVLFFSKTSYLLSASLPKAHAVPSAASGPILHTWTQPGSMGSRTSDTSSMPPSWFKPASKTCWFGHPSPNTAARSSVHQSSGATLLCLLQFPDQQQCSDCSNLGRSLCTVLHRLVQRKEIFDMFCRHLRVCTRIEVCSQQGCP